MNRRASLEKESDDVMHAPPLHADEEARTAALAGLERQVAGMGSHMTQYAPRVQLLSDGRLVLGLTTDLDQPMPARYPRLHAETLPPDPRPLEIREAALAGRLRRLEAEARPFMPVLEVPVPDASSAPVHAIPLGFLPVRGLEVNWNGNGWHVTSAHVPLLGPSEGAPLAGEPFTIPEQRLPAEEGLVHVRWSVQYDSYDTRAEDYLEQQHRLKVLGARIALTKGDLAAGSEIGLSGQAMHGSADHHTMSFSAGEAISALAYVIPPSGDYQAPIVITLGRGAYPNAHGRWGNVIPEHGGGIEPGVET